jgi:hypothetical protein
VRTFVFRPLKWFWYVSGGSFFSSSLIISLVRLWSQRVKIGFSAAKTQALMVSTNVKPPKITLDGIRIKITPKIKYLGVIIDNKFSFKQHIEYVCYQAHRSLVQLSSLAKSYWGIGSSSMRTIYLGQDLEHSEIDG